MVFIALVGRHGIEHHTEEVVLNRFVLGMRSVFLRFRLLCSDYATIGLL